MGDAGRAERPVADDGAAVPPVAARLRDRVVAYFVVGYPAMSETFVRDEIATLRAAGLTVDVTSMSAAHQSRIPLSWSGPVRTMEDVTWPEAVRDALWWLARPRAVGRLARLLHRSGYPGLRQLVRGVPTVARRLAARDVALCHTHFGWRAMVSAQHVGALLGRPTTVTLHAADIYLAGTGFARRVNQCDHVVTVCGYNVERLVALGVDRERVSVVPCGVDVHVEATPPEEPTRVVSVGRLVPKKGMDVLVRAFAEVVSALPAAHLEIVGDGREDGALRALVADLGLEDHVTLAGALDHASTVERIRRAGVFALACRVAPNGDSDAVPVALREAMVRGRPVVTTAVAGIPENVDDEVGWLVRPEDPDALAAALLEALRDPVLAAARGAAARARQVAHYSLERSAASLVARWDALLGAGSA